MLCLMGVNKFSPNLLTTLNEVSSILNLKMHLKERKKVDVFSFNIHQTEYGIQKFRKKVEFFINTSEPSSFGSFIEIKCINILGFFNNITRTIIR